MRISESLPELEGYNVRTQKCKRITHEGATEYVFNARRANQVPQQISVVVTQQVIPRVVEFNGHSFPLAVDRHATDRMVEVNLLDGSLSLPPTPDTMDMYLQKVATTANIVKDNYAQMFNPS